MRSCSAAASGSPRASADSSCSSASACACRTQRAPRRDGSCSARLRLSPARRRCWATQRGAARRPAAAGERGRRSRRAAGGAARGPSPRRPACAALVREVVAGLGSRDLAHDTLRHQLVERAHGLLVAAPARLRARCRGRTSGRSPPPRRAPGARRRRAGPSRAPRRLRTSRGQRVLARSRPPRAAPRGTRRRTAAGPRSPGRRAAAGRARRRPGGRPNELRHLALLEPRRADDRRPPLARQVDGQPAQPVAGGHGLAAPADHEQQRPASEPAAQIGDRRRSWPRPRRGRRRAARSLRGALAGRAEHRGHALQQADAGRPGRSSGSGAGTSALERRQLGQRAARRRPGAAAGGRPASPMRPRPARPRAAARRPARKGAPPRRRGSGRPAPRPRRSARGSRQLVAQPRLPDARLALDHGETAVGLGGGVGARERRQLPRRVPPAAARGGRPRRDRRRPAMPGAAMRRRRASVPSFTCSYRAAVSSSGATPSSRLSVRTQSRYCASAAARSPLQAYRRISSRWAGSWSGSISSQRRRVCDRRARSRRAREQLDQALAAPSPARAPARPPRRSCQSSNAGAVAQREALQESRRRTARRPCRAPRATRRAASARNRATSSSSRPSPQGDAVARRIDQLRADRPAQGRQRAPQRAARALAVVRGPQQLAQRFARPRALGQRQVRQQCDRLARVEGHRLAVPVERAAAPSRVISTAMAPRYPLWGRSRNAYRTARRDTAQDGRERSHRPLCHRCSRDRRRRRRSAGRHRAGASAGCTCSPSASARALDAHTVLASGGINAALGTMDPRGHLAAALRRHARGGLLSWAIPGRRRDPSRGRHRAAVEELADWGLPFAREPARPHSTSASSAPTAGGAPATRATTPGRDILHTLATRAAELAIPIVDDALRLRACSSPTAPASAPLASTCTTAPHRVRRRRRRPLRRRPHAHLAAQLLAPRRELRRGDGARAAGRLPPEWTWSSCSSTPPAWSRRRRPPARWSPRPCAARAASCTTPTASASWRATTRERMEL